MGFIPAAFAMMVFRDAQYAEYVKHCEEVNEQPVSREEWDKKEAEKREPGQPYSDYMK